MCFYSKASPDERWLWHKKISHLNFKTMNSLVKRELVRGFHKMEFSSDGLCEAYEKGKSKRASHKKKTMIDITEPLQLLHMDLFGPVNIAEVEEKKAVALREAELQKEVEILNALTQTEKLKAEFLSKASVEYETKDEQHEEDIHYSQIVTTILHYRHSKSFDDTVVESVMLQLKIPS
ncbi:hypothetical protein AgCh_012588 [Apium graveolens]